MKRRSSATSARVRSRSGAGIERLQLLRDPLPDHHTRMSPDCLMGRQSPVCTPRPSGGRQLWLKCSGPTAERRGRPAPIPLAGLPCERPSRMHARTCLMGSVGVKVSGSALGSQKAPKARLPGVTRATSLSRAGESAWLLVIAICQFNQRVDVIGRNRPAIQGAEGA